MRLLLGKAAQRLGNAEAARAAFETVVASTPALRAPVPSDLGPPNDALRTPLEPLDLLAVSALHALGRGTELQMLAESEPPSSPAHAFATDWTRALVDGDVDPGEAARRLALDHDGLFEALEGQILLRTLTIRD